MDPKLEADVDLYYQVVMKRLKIAYTIFTSFYCMSFADKKMAQDEYKKIYDLVKQGFRKLTKVIKDPSSSSEDVLLVQKVVISKVINYLNEMESDVKTTEDSIFKRLERIFSLAYRGTISYERAIELVDNLMTENYKELRNSIDMLSYGSMESIDKVHKFLSKVYSFASKSSRPDYKRNCLELLEMIIDVEKRVQTVFVFQIGEYIDDIKRYSSILRKNVREAYR